MFGSLVFKYWTINKQKAELVKTLKLTTQNCQWKLSQDWNKGNSGKFLLLVTQAMLLLVGLFIKALLKSMDLLWRAMLPVLDMDYFKITYFNRKWFKTVEILILWKYLPTACKLFCLLGSWISRGLEQRLAQLTWLLWQDLILLLSSLFHTKALLCWEAAIQSQLKTSEISGWHSPFF